MQPYNDVLLPYVGAGFFKGERVFVKKEGFWGPEKSSGGGGEDLLPPPTVEQSWD